MPGPPTAQVHPPIPLMEQGSGRLLGEPCNAQAEVWRRRSQGEEVEAESKWLAQGLMAGRAKLRVPAAHSPRITNRHLFLDPQIVSLRGDADLTAVNVCRGPDVMLGDPGGERIRCRPVH